MSGTFCIVFGRVFKSQAGGGCVGCAGEKDTPLCCELGDCSGCNWIEQDITPTTITPTTDRAAVVDKGYHWRPIDANTPRGTKLQLIRRDACVALYGALGTDNEFFTHWAPLPTFED